MGILSNFTVQLIFFSLQKADEKYEEVDEREKMPHYEQKKWEEEQMSSATYRFGAKDASTRKRDDYDLVIGEQIEFIQALQLAGTKGIKKVREYVSTPAPA